MTEWTSKVELKLDELGELVWENQTCEVQKGSSCIVRTAEFQPAVGSLPTHA